MENKFRMIRKETRKNLELKLVGDFDGSAAHSLINELKKGCGKCRRISVDTSGLRHVLPFARGVLKSHFSMPAEQMNKIVFTGDKAGVLNPREG